MTISVDPPLSPTGHCQCGRTILGFDNLTGRDDRREMRRTTRISMSINKLWNFHFWHSVRFPRRSQRVCIAWKLQIRPLPGDVTRAKREDDMRTT